MSGDDAKGMINALSELKHDDFVVIKVRATVMDHDDDSGIFMMDECSACEQDMPDGTAVFIWGEPCGQDPESVHNGSLVALKVCCSEDCVEQAVNEWAGSVGFAEYAIGYFA